MPSFSYRNLPPAVIQTNLVAGWHFIEGWNQIVFNRVNSPVYQNPPNLLGAFSDQYLQHNDTSAVRWILTGATITDFFATGPPPNSIANAASRLVTASGSSLMFYTLTLANVPYTLSVWARSNTGSSQNFRMGNVSAAGSDKTITTTWTQFTETFTPTAGSVLVGFLNDVAHDALDILICDVELVLGSSANTTYTPQTLNLQLGAGPDNATNDPAWGAAGLDFGPSTFAKGVSSTPITFTNITCYGVFKKTGADAPSFFEPILTSGSETTPQYGVVMESRDSLNSGTSANSTGPCFGFGFTNPRILNAANVKIDDGFWHVFVGTYDGTNLKLYIDGTQVAQKPITIPAQTVHQFMLGCYDGNNSASTNYFPGSIGMIALYTDAHTPTQIRQNTTAMQGDMACRGVAMTPPTHVIGIEGDSIPAGLGIAQAQRWSWLMLQNLSPTIQQWDGAVGGSTTVETTARVSVFTQLYTNPSVTNKILVIHLGANDMMGSTTAPTFIANYKVLLALYKSTVSGLKILVHPVLARKDAGAVSVGFNAKRNTANATMLSDPDFSNGVCADGVITINATMMDDNAPDDTTLFQTDKVHPTALGNSLYLWPGVQTSVATLV